MTILRRPYKHRYKAICEPDYPPGSADRDGAKHSVEIAFMVSLSNHEGVVRPTARAASWFDKLTMKRFSDFKIRLAEPAR